MSERASGLAIVTGAASGMGEAVARRFAADGWPIVLCDFNAEGLAVIADELGSVTEVRTLAGDVSSPDFAAGLVEVLAEQPVGALVHCAGISTSMAEPARILDVNLGGTLRLVELVRPRISAGGAAVLITTMVEPGPLDEALAKVRTPEDVASLLEHIPNSGMAYIASKRALQLLSQREAWAFGERDARIVTISPGIIDTPMARHEQIRHPIMAEMLSLVPQRRMGTPAEIASAAAFLCSPDASFINGSDILVDGGLVGRRLADRLEQDAS